MSEHDLCPMAAPHLTLQTSQGANSEERGERGANIVPCPSCDFVEKWDELTQYIMLAQAQPRSEPLKAPG